MNYRERIVINPTIHFGKPCVAGTRILAEDVLELIQEGIPCQAFFLGRPKLPVSRVVESMHANQRSVKEAAQDWQLPVEAVEEALDYYQRFRDVIEADAAEELALSEQLAHRDSSNCEAVHR